MFAPGRRRSVTVRPGTKKKKKKKNRPGKKKCYTALTRTGRRTAPGPNPCAKRREFVTMRLIRESNTALP
jgi:hypothetical protein